jgi:hypothetical protein
MQPNKKKGIVFLVLAISCLSILGIILIFSATHICNQFWHDFTRDLGIAFLIAAL